VTHAYLAALAGNAWSGKVVDGFGNAYVDDR
jgi:hypothetical protein